MAFTQVHPSTETPAQTISLPPRRIRCAPKPGVPVSRLVLPIQDGFNHYALIAVISTLV